MTQTRLYSTQTHQNRVGFVSCSRVVSNFVSLSHGMSFVFRRRDVAFVCCYHNATFICVKAIQTSKVYLISSRNQINRR